MRCNYLSMRIDICFWYQCIHFSLKRNTFALLPTFSTRDIYPFCCFFHQSKLKLSLPRSKSERDISQQPHLVSLGAVKGPHGNIAGMLLPLPLGKRVTGGRVPLVVGINLEVASFNWKKKIVPFFYMIIETWICTSVQLHYFELTNSCCTILGIVRNRKYFFVSRMIFRVDWQTFNQYEVDWHISQEKVPICLTILFYLMLLISSGMIFISWELMNIFCKEC